jgi:hypothetical protein
MEFVAELLQDGKKRRYALLIVIVLMTIPCYCAGFTALRQAPDRFTPTQSPTSMPSSETPQYHTPLTTPETSTITQSPTITNTGFVPPSHTPSFTPGPTATQNITPFILDTETPTLTLTPVPSDTPTSTQFPTTTDTVSPPTSTATEGSG